MDSFFVFRNVTFSYSFFHVIRYGAFTYAQFFC